MDVVGREVLEDLKRAYPDVRGRADAWLQEAMEATWTRPNDVKKTYASASILSGNRMVFDFGKRYRLVVRIAYRTGKVMILRAGTHAEYDRWDLSREE